MVGIGLFILAAFCLFLYSCSGPSKSSLSPFKKDEIKDEKQVINPSSTSSTQQDERDLVANQPIDLQKDELKRVAMIIESSGDCYAKNSYGDIIEITEEQCRLLSRKNSRIPLSKLKRQQESQPVNVNHTESTTPDINESVIYGT